MIADLRKTAAKHFRNRVTDDEVVLEADNAPFWFSGNGASTPHRTRDCRR